VLHGAKCRAEDRPHRHRTAGGPGVFDRVPGPSLLGRGLQLKWNASLRLAREIREKKTDARASAADGGRLRFDYVVDDVNKPKMTINRLPGYRWTNRAFPRNHADLDRHPQLGAGAEHDASMLV
jgi:hypothetical protein